MAAIEPQFAGEYEDRTTAAVKSVLIEIGQTLGSYEGKVAVIGGAVPWLLLPRAADMRHIGTGDVDLSLDAEALGDGEYAQLVALLQKQGYHQRADARRFQLVRTVPSRVRMHTISTTVPETIQVASIISSMRRCPSLTLNPRGRGTV